MKRYQILIIAIAVSVIGAIPARGADLNNYIVGKMGSYTPNSSDLRGYSTDFNGEFAFGRYFNPNTALELGVGYFQTGGDVTVYDSGTYLGNEKIEVTPLTLSLRLIQPLSNWTEIYMTGGIGAYFVHDSIDASNYHLGYLHLNDNTTSFGAHLGGGLNFNITRNVFVGGEFKYVWMTADLYGDRVDLSGLRVTGDVGVRF